MVEKKTRENKDKIKVKTTKAKPSKTKSKSTKSKNLPTSKFKSRGLLYIIINSRTES